MGCDHHLLLQEYSELQQALAELAIIYSDAPVGLAVIGTDFRFKRINARLAEINGLPIEAHLGRTVREVVPGLADAAEALIRKVAETGEPLLNLEIEGETPAEPGVVRSFIEHWTPLKGASGEVVAVNIVAEEVTNRKRAAEALRVSEARCREVLDAIHEGFLVMDRDFRILEMNREALRIDGRSFQELYGRTCWEVWPAAVGTAVEAAYRRVLKEQLPAELEHYYVSDTHDIWLAISAYPTTDGLAVFYRDISEKKRSEEQLRESESRAATALRAGQLGVFEFRYSPEPTYYWDNTVRSIWGVSSDHTVTDEFFWSSLHPDDIRKVRRATARASHHLGPHRYDVEYRILRQPGNEVRWVKVAADIVFNAAKPVKMIGTIKDITDRKTAEEHAQMLMREVNHRSKNLLSVVQSIAHQMARTADPNIFAARFSERLSALASCQDLLVRAHWKGIDLETLVSAQLAHLQPLIGHRIHISGPALLVSSSAAQALGMAFHELATNAVKYGALSNEEGQVTVTWKEHGPGHAREFSLEWRETAGPAVVRPRHTGLGSHILKRMMENSLNSKVTIDFAPAGLGWSLKAPAAGVLERGAQHTPER
ncbi:PAS domain-containing protein [Aestuariivirga sp.]|uniref:PAS domain-containing protein n=1 Tax=Aestuariivirga sp. TaxID=2650926 RepID=UPI0039188D59